MDGWVELLSCPACAAPMFRADTVVGCPTGHRFDIARQGHLNLLQRAAPLNADTPQMVAARARFLDAGHYRAISDAVLRQVSSARRIIEVGAGTGHHLARVLDQLPATTGLAVDISTAAARKAAKAHPRMAAVVADTWQRLPLRDGSVDAVLCIFAPRNAAEFRRVLSPGGVVVVVSPNPGHLAQFREQHGLLGIEPDKARHLTDTMSAHLRASGGEQVQRRLPLDAEAARDLIAMGPNAFHGTPQAAPAVSAVLDVAVSVFTRTDEVP